MRMHRKHNETNENRSRYTVEVWWSLPPLLIASLFRKSFLLLKTVLKYNTSLSMVRKTHTRFARSRDWTICLSRNVLKENSNYTLLNKLSHFFYSLCSFCTRWVTNEGKITNKIAKKKLFDNREIVNGFKMGTESLLWFIICFRNTNTHVTITTSKTDWAENKTKIQNRKTIAHDEKTPMESNEKKNTYETTKNLKESTRHEKLKTKD